MTVRSQRDSTLFVFMRHQVRDVCLFTCIFITCIINTRMYLFIQMMLMLLCFSQVSTNGFISLSEPTAESEYLRKMPAEFGMIAAFMGDLDNSDGLGNVYFRQDRSPDVLRRAAVHIARAFPSDDEIKPVHVLIVTWEHVTPQGSTGRGDEIQDMV